MRPLNFRSTSLTLAAAAAVSVAPLGLAGCGQPAAPTPQAATTPKANHEEGHDHDHDRDHPHEGPHHGGLIELGDEEYHAELVHDEKAGSVTIYVLDSKAKTAVPIEAKEVTINLKHGGEAEQYKLAAKPESSDGEGKSSRFESTDEGLAHGLDHDDAEPQLVLEIAGKQYRGKIVHSHEGHDHEHDKEAPQGKQ